MAGRLRDFFFFEGKGYRCRQSPVFGSPAVAHLVGEIAANGNGPLVFCAWALAGQRLELSDTEFWVNGPDGEKLVTHQAIFGTRKPVPADWFSGLLELDPVDRRGPSVSLVFEKGVLDSARP